MPVFSKKIYSKSIFHLNLILTPCHPSDDVMERLFQEHLNKNAVRISVNILRKCKIIKLIRRRAFQAVMLSEVLLR